VKQLIGLLLLTFTLQPMFAKDNYPLTIKVLKTQNVENKNGTFTFAKLGGNAGAGWSHKVAEHVMAEGSDGNTYELVPQNPKDMLLPGTFQAKIEKRDMKVCEPKDNGKCRYVKFKVVGAEQTAASEQTPAPTK
jgi:hypothetical protein